MNVKGDKTVRNIEDAIYGLYQKLPKHVNSNSYIFKSKLYYVLKEDRQLGIVLSKENKVSNYTYYIDLSAMYGEDREDSIENRLKEKGVDSFIHLFYNKVGGGKYTKKKDWAKVYDDLLVYGLGDEYYNCAERIRGKYKEDTTPNKFKIEDGGGRVNGKLRMALTRKMEGEETGFEYETKFKDFLHQHGMILEQPYEFHSSQYKFKVVSTHIKTLRSINKRLVQYEKYRESIGNKV